MEYVETRLQNRKKEIKRITRFLDRGDRAKILMRTGLSKRSIYDTLDANHPLFVKKVISAAWDLIEESGRLPKGIEKPTPEYIANL